jgi:hypothetical protein
MSDAPLPACPSCGTRDRVVKLSRIYFDALSMIAHPGQDLPESLSLLQGAKARKPGGIGRLRYYHELVKMTGPPSGRRKASQILHPDAVVFVFAAISGLLLLEMFRTGPKGLLFAAVVLALALAAYFLERPVILRRYRGAREVKEGEALAVRAAVEKWMKLYYCGGDGTVFDPESGRTYPADGLAGALLQETPGASKKHL